MTSPEVLEDLRYFAKKISLGLEKDKPNFSSIMKETKRLSLLLEAEDIYSEVRRAREAVIIELENEIDLQNMRNNVKLSDMYLAHLVSYKTDNNTRYIYKSKYSHSDVEITEEEYMDIVKETIQRVRDSNV